MSKKFIIPIIILCILFTSCEKKTLEEVINNDKNINTKIETMFDESGLDADIEVKVNTINITIDLEDELKNLKLDKKSKKVLKSELSNNFESKESEFSNLISSLEEESNVENVVININTKYNKKNFWSISFNRKGILRE